MPDIESHFLGNLVSILLESCCTAIDYNHKIFPHPLHACEFEDYKLTASWRSKHGATLPPYADTIANQLNRSSTLGCSKTDFEKRFQVKRTMTLQFHPSIVQTQIFDNNISTTGSSFGSLTRKLNISTLNSFNQHNWNQNLGSYLFLFFCSHGIMFHVSACIYIFI